MIRNPLHRRLDRVERRQGGDGPSELARLWCTLFGGDPEEFPYRTLVEMVEASFAKERTT
jgi:hypothetical protein